MTDELWRKVNEAREVYRSAVHALNRALDEEMLSRMRDRCPVCEAPMSSAGHGRGETVVGHPIVYCPEVPPKQLFFRSAESH